jgi:hypothetical protein
MQASEYVSFSQGIGYASLPHVMSSFTIRERGECVPNHKTSSAIEVDMLGSLAFVSKHILLHQFKGQALPFCRFRAAVMKLANALSTLSQGLKRLELHGKIRNPYA